jgi:hypothetical protein
MERRRLRYFAFQPGFFLGNIKENPIWLEWPIWPDGAFFGCMPVV